LKTKRNYPLEKLYWNNGIPENHPYFFELVEEIHDLPPSSKLDAVSLIGCIKNDESKNIDIEELEDEEKNNEIRLIFEDYAGK